MTDKTDYKAVLEDVARGMLFDKKHGGGKLKPNISEKMALFKHSKTIQKALEFSYKAQSGEVSSAMNLRGLDVFFTMDDDNVSLSDWNAELEQKPKKIFKAMIKQLFSEVQGG